MSHDPKAALKAAQKAVKSAQKKAKPKKRPKYNNKKTDFEGVTYDSGKEAKRAAELKLIAQAGQIRDLATKKEFPLKVNNVLVCIYESDFTYIDCKTGKLVVEDVKSAFTRTLPVYRIKNKLMRACYGIEILET